VKERGREGGGEVEGESRGMKSGRDCAGDKEERGRKVKVVPVSG